MSLLGLKAAVMALTGARPRTMHVARCTILRIWCSMKLCPSTLICSQGCPCAAAVVSHWTVHAWQLVAHRPHLPHVNVCSSMLPAHLDVQHSNAAAGEHVALGCRVAGRHAGSEVVKVVGALVGVQHSIQVTPGCLSLSRGHC